MYLGTEFSNFVCWPFVAGPGNWGLDPVDVSFDSDHDPASPPRDLRGDGQCCDVTGPCAWANLWRFTDILCLMADDFLAGTASYPARLVLGRSHDSR